MNNYYEKGYQSPSILDSKIESLVHTVNNIKSGLVTEYIGSKDTPNSLVNRMFNELKMVDE